MVVNTLVNLKAQPLSCTFGFIPRGQSIMFNLKNKKMVTIKNYIKRTSKKTGKDFYVLELAGGLDPVKSAEGKLYFTSRTCTVPSSFDEQTCKSMLGLQIPGSIRKVECPEYEYTIPSTNQTVTLNYKWEFVENPQEVMQQQLISEELVY